jgi:pilus assembly protein Flp/PilA
VPRLRLGERKNRRTSKMNNLLLKLYVKAQDLVAREEGQDLVEYALLVALVALGSIAAIGYVTTALGKVFSSISASI